MSLALVISKALHTLMAFGSTLSDDETRGWFADLIAAAVREKRDLSAAELLEISRRTELGLDELQAVIDQKQANS